MKVLGIETSCDETAVALVENGKKILSNVVATSLHLHKRYGGIVPEIATRHQVEFINYVLKQALDQAGVELSQVGLLAAVSGPGLVGTLLIGVSLAKALSLSSNIPLIGINHLQAHLYATLMSSPSPKLPFVGLIVSGGHTNLIYVRDLLNWEVLGRTRDDAAGEAFDKVAKILNLGYPGGPIIEKTANAFDPNKIRFPRSYLEQDSLDFSFSGLKTAVLYYVRNHNGRNNKYEIGEVAAGFQEAVIDTLAEKALRACRLKKVKHFAVGGGVIANQRLRMVLTKTLQAQGIAVHFPDFSLCQDNAAMVAGLGYQLYRRGVVSDLNLEVTSTIPGY